MGAASREPVAMLREALRGGSGCERADRLAVDKAAAPLIEAFFERLVRFCDGQARRAGRSGLDGDDLAAHAWQKTLRYLAGPRGDRVNDATHFGHILMDAAHMHLLDTLARPSSQVHVALDAPLGDEAGAETLGERLPDPAATAELLLPSDSRYLRLVEQLFTDPDAFRATYRQANQRHPRNYQALVLYQMGVFWREEIVGGESRDEERAEYLREWVRLLGVPEPVWAAIERAAETTCGEPPNGCCPVLLAAVNAACGTNLRDRGTLAVLRHEMNRFAAMSAGPAEFADAPPDADSVADTERRRGRKHTNRS